MENCLMAIQFGGRMNTYHEKDFEHFLLIQQEGIAYFN